MSEKIVAISLLIVKSIEFGKSKVTKVIFFLKRISSNLKNLGVLRLYKLILGIINISFAWNSF